MFRLYRHSSSIFMQKGPEWRRGSFSFDELFTAPEAIPFLTGQWERGQPVAPPEADRDWDPPLENQEVWAAGVTYFRSRTARMEESEDAGGDKFYDLVYEAERPELFFKATAPRVRGHRQTVGIRRDSSWDVPEPELTLALDSAGRVFGATVGNDMSSRSIEGENPLYLPQAKVYNGSCALGPCLLVGSLPGPEAGIRLEIERAGEPVFDGATDLSQLKRGYDELASFLVRENTLPVGGLLMTGTGIVPDHPFTLQAGDLVRITIDRIGTLVNTVAPASQL